MFRIVEAIADDEIIRTFEADIRALDIRLLRIVLTQQSRNLDGCGVA